MKIKELIDKLTEIKKEHGNLSIDVSDNDLGVDEPSTVTVSDNTIYNLDGEVAGTEKRVFIS